ncbi:trigger factor [Lachnospiraceae bacterium ZAX-1]
MKRKIVVLLAAICVLSMIGGCGKKSSADAYNLDELVSLGEYKGLAVTLDSYETTDADVKEYAESIIVNNPNYEATDKTTVEDGDVVDIDYEGLKDGIAFDGGTAQGAILTIGSGQFISGFEEGLIGVNVGESVALDLTFPEGYQDETLSGQAVVFNVKVNAIVEGKEITYDKLTDDYVFKNFGIETVEAFIDVVRENLQTGNETDKVNDTQAAVFAKLKEVCEVKEIPQALLDARVAEFTEEFTASYKQTSDLELKEYLETTYQMTEEEFKTQATEDVKETLTIELILEAIAKKEKIKVDEEGYDAYLENMMAYNGIESKEELLKQKSEDYLKKMYTCSEALKIVQDNAVITYEDAQEEATEKAPEETTE